MERRSSPSGWRLGFVVSLSLAASLASRAEAQFPAFSQTQTLSSTFFGQTTTRGFSFTVSTPLIVSQLGFWDSTPPGGLVVAHPAALWADDGTLLTSATVPAGTGAALDGGYRWVATAPVALAPGHTYVVGVYFPLSDSEFFPNAPQNVVFDPRVSFVLARLSNMTGLTFPSGDGTFSGGQFSANFKATTALQVPVLPWFGAIALVLLLLGTLVGRMRVARGAPIVGALIALTVLCAPQSSAAASLSLASTARLVVSVGVVASVGGNPIPPVMDLPTTGAVVGGGLSLVPQGDQLDLSFTFSMFDDANPLVLTGSYGAAYVPVTLRIDEIFYQSPASGQLPARVSLGDTLLLGSVTGTARGTLTVGTSVVPFTIFTDHGWYSDGTPEPYLSGRVGLDRVALGDDVTGGGSSRDSDPSPTRT